MYLNISGYYLTFLARVSHKTDCTVIQLQVYLVVYSCSHLEQKDQFPCNCFKKKKEGRKAGYYRHICINYQTLPNIIRTKPKMKKKGSYKKVIRIHEQKKRALLNKSQIHSKFLQQSFINTPKGLLIFMYSNKL